MWLREVMPHIFRGFGLMIFMFVILWLLGMGANWLFREKTIPETGVPLSEQPGSYPVSNVNLVKQKEERHVSLS